MENRCFSHKEKLNAVRVPKARFRVSLEDRFFHDGRRGCTLMHLPATISETQIAHTRTATRLAHRRLDENKFFFRVDTLEEKKREEQEVGKQDIRSLRTGTP